MTTISVKSGTVMFKQFITLLLFLSSFNSANAQLDSVSVSSITFTQDVLLDSLNNPVDTFDIMRVEIFVDDIDFMGEVVLVVYDLTTDYPLSLSKQTKAELDTANLIAGSTATVELLGVEPITSSYKIEIQVRDFQGGNLPLITTTY